MLKFGAGLTVCVRRLSLVVRASPWRGLGWTVAVYSSLFLCVNECGFRDTLTISNAMLCSLLGIGVASAGF